MQRHPTTEKLTTIFSVKNFLKFFPYTLLYSMMNALR